ncbi:MAG: hypothetical protein LUE16_06465 [Lachnospiraceae bacterium]|nr:hypothetical protein [Lachnospiraceae bacterium]
MLRILLFQHQVGLFGRDYGPVIPDGMYTRRIDGKEVKQRLLTDVTARYDNDIIRGMHYYAENIKYYMTESYIYQMCRDNNHNLLFSVGLNYYGWCSEYHTMGEVREFLGGTPGKSGIILDDRPYSTAGLKRYYREKVIAVEPDDKKARKNKKISIIEGVKDCAPSKPADAGMDFHVDENGINEIFESLLGEEEWGK